MGRSNAKGVFLKNKGYVFSGGDNWYDNPQSVVYKDCWEYDISSNQWVRKSDLPIGFRDGIAFVVNNKLYAGLGHFTGNSYNQIYEFDVDGNAWITKSEYPGNGRGGSIVAVVQNKAYIGLGTNRWWIGNVYDSKSFNDFWKYAP